MRDQQWITDDGLTLVEVVPYFPAFMWYEPNYTRFCLRRDGISTLCLGNPRYLHTRDNSQ